MFHGESARFMWINSLASNRAIDTLFQTTSLTHDGHRYGTIGAGQNRIHSRRYVDPIRLTCIGSPCAKPRPAYACSGHDIDRERSVSGRPLCRAGTLMSSASWNAP
jgi:hypothetical protein